MAITRKNNHRPFDPKADLMSLQDYAKQKYVHPKTVTYWIRKQKIRAWKIFGRWYVEI